MRKVLLEQAAGSWNWLECLLVAERRARRQPAAGLCLGTAALLGFVAVPARDSGTGSPARSGSGVLRIT